MLFKTLKFALVGCVVLAAASSAVAAPIVTMEQNVVGTFNALDFFYSSTPGGEFLNYRLDVQNANGPLLADPMQAARSDEGSDAVDTFMNTVGSFLGAGTASYQHNTYTPTGFTPDPQPTQRIDWSVFDTLEGDTNSVGGGAPFHLARVLVLPTGMGTATFTAFDTLTLDTSGQPIPTRFDFTFGEPVTAFEVDDDVWVSSSGSSDSSADADGNGDGIVDAADYVIWPEHTTGSTGSLEIVPFVPPPKPAYVARARPALGLAAVPEPSSLMLLVALSACLTLRRTNR